LSHITCLGSHTVTGILCTMGNQFADWTAPYRFYSKPRYDQDTLYAVLRRGVVQELDADEPLVTAIDDSILRKTGKRTPGVSYRRDPLGPPFQTNLVLAQRVLQISAQLPDGPHTRMVPIDFQHAPTPKKPRKSSPPEDWEEYERLSKQCNINLAGAERIKHLRVELDRDEPQRDRQLWVTADGRFTNKTVMRDLPDRTVFIGRIRSDASLHHPPTPEPGKRGRRRSYGDKSPTPDELRCDTSVPWQEITVDASGGKRTFKIKTLAPLLWRPAGHKLPLRLIVIGPTPYRLRKGSKLLYRKPAYIITTDLDSPAEQIVQAYIRRWGIEVNFRDEKQLFGVGQAQVRSPESVQAAPALAVASYSALLLSAHRASKDSGGLDTLPPPKWRSSRSKAKPTTQDMRQAMRNEMWGQALKRNFSGFMYAGASDVKPQKSHLHLPYAVLYAK